MKTNYKCIPFIISNDWNIYSEHGYGNGYVAITKDHPLYGKNYSDKIPYDKATVKFNDNYIGAFINMLDTKDDSTLSIDLAINVHCGITYASQCTNNMLERAEFLTDDKPTKDHWIFGFDTAHCNDNADNWAKERVIAETLNFMKQLESFEMYNSNL